MVDIDDIRIVVKGEIGDATRKLKDLKKQGVKSAKSIKDAFGTAFGIFLSSRIISGIKNIFKSSLQTAVQLEAFGKRAKTVFGDAIDSVQEFADESAAALGLTKTEALGAAAAIGDLIRPLGATRKESARVSKDVLKLSGALKAFTGDSRDVSEISAIVSKSFLGETEALKGLGIAISAKQIKDEQAIQSAKGLKFVTEELSKAAAVEALLFQKSADALAAFEERTESLEQVQNKLNASLKESGESLSKGLVPILKPIAELITSIVNSVVGFFNSLSSTGKAAILLGAALVALIPTIGGLITAFKGISSLIGPSAPFILGIIAVTVAITALVVIIDELTKAQEEFISPLVESSNEIDKLEKRVKALNKEEKKSKEQKLLLARANKALALTAENLGIAIRKENGALKTNLELIKEIRKEQLKQAKTRFLELEKELGTFTSANFRKQVTNLAEMHKFNSDNIKLQKERRELVKKFPELMAKETKETKDNIENLGESIKKTSDFLQTEFEKNLLGINKKLQEFEKSIRKFGKSLGLTAIEIESMVTQAITKTNRLITEELENNTKLILEFNEERLKIAESTLDKEFKMASEALDNKFRYENTELEKARKQQLELEKTFEAKKAKIQLDAAREALNDINKIIKGIKSGGLEGILGVTGGIAGILPAELIPGGQVVKTAIQPILGIFEDLFGGLFEGLEDTGRELERQEEAKKKLIKEQNELIQAQISFAQALRDLSRDRSKLLSIEAERQIRLIRLTEQDEAKRRVLERAVLEPLAAERARELGAAAPAQAVETLSKLGRQDVVVKSILNLLPTLSTIPGDLAGFKEREKQLTTALEEPDIPQEIRNILEANLKLVKDTLLEFPGGRGGLAGLGGGVTLGGPIAPIFDPADVFVPLSQAQEAAIKAIKDDLEDRLAAGDEFLTIIERLNAMSLESDKSLQETLRLQPGRAVSFVDIGRRGVQDITGQFAGARPALGLPTGIGGVAVAQERVKSFQERQANSLEEAVDELKRQTTLLALIAAATDESQNTSAQVGEQFIINTLNQIGDKQIA